MNILIVSSILPPEIGGPASYVPEVVQRLKDKVKFEIITFTKSPSKIDGAEISAVSQEGNSIVRQVRLFWTIFKKIRTIDVIFAQDPQVVGLVSAIIGKIGRKKTIIKFVGDPVWEKNYGKERTTLILADYLKKPDTGIKSKLEILITKIALKLSSVIITPSNYLRDIIVERYSIEPKKVVVIKNAVSTGNFLKRKFISKNNYTAITIARLVKWKNIAGIIRANKNFNSSEKTKVKLIIVGDGPLMSELKKISDNSIYFTGSITREKTLNLLQKADVFILNSIYEGLPHTVLEAFSVGTPVISTEIPGTNEVAINNKTALTVTPGSDAELLFAMKKILLSPKLAEKISTAGFNELATNCTWEKTTNELYKVLTG